MTIDPRTYSTQFGVVSGGQQSDPDPLKSCGMKFFNPSYHGPNIDPTDMPFCSPPTIAGQPFTEMYYRPPDPGTIITYKRLALGEGQTGIPDGAYGGGINGTGQTVAGNIGLYQLIRRVQRFTTGIQVKPRVVEKMVDGALVREKQEKGQDWMHNMTQGIAPHAAWNPIAGQFLQEMKNIETALQSFAQIPNAGALAQLPGSIMNLGSLLKGLTNRQKSKATQNMPPLVAQGFESMVNLMSDTETSGMTMTGGRINPEVFTENMIELLSQVTNISDLVDVMFRLHYDESIRGLEEYAKSADTGLTANTNIVIAGEDEEEVSYLTLNKSVGESIVYFTEGYSINVGSQTHIVISAEQDSGEITVFPKIEDEFVNERVRVYLPVAEIEVEGPYGPMTMDIDMNGNMKPNKNSAQALQQAMQALQSIMSLCQSASQGKSLFGDAAGIMGQLFNRIPNNGAREMLQNVANNTDIKKTAAIISRTLKSNHPFRF
jgi:hypothetical protein